MRLAPNHLEPLDLFASEGRNPENFREILNILANKGPMIKNEIAKALGRREGDVSKRIDWLIEYGFLEIAKNRVKKSKFRTIKLKEYRPTLKGIFAISHKNDFDPVKTLQFYEVPEILRQLINSFGNDKLRAYINRVATRVKKSIDGTPPFERINDDQVLFWPLLRFGLEELPTLIGSGSLDKTIERNIQQVIVNYSDSIVRTIDVYIGQISSQIESVKAFRKILVDSKTDPSKIKQLFDT